MVIKLGRLLQAKKLRADWAASAEPSHARRAAVNALTGPCEATAPTKALLVNRALQVTTRIAGHIAIYVD